MDEAGRKRAEATVMNTLRRIFQLVRYREYLAWRLAMHEVTKLLERHKREPET